MVTAANAQVDEDLKYYEVAERGAKERRMAELKKIEGGEDLYRRYKEAANQLNIH